MSIAKNTKETFLEEIIDNLSGNTRELPVDCKPRTREEILLAAIEMNTRSRGGGSTDGGNVDLSDYLHRVYDKATLNDVSQGDLDDAYVTPKVIVDYLIELLSNTNINVLSVNGKTGAVIIGREDVELDNVINEKQATKREFDEHLNETENYHVTQQWRNSVLRRLDALEKQLGTSVTKNMKATTDLALEGEDDTTYMTPFGIKKLVDKIVSENGTVTRPTIGDLNIGDTYIDPTMIYNNSPIEWIVVDKSRYNKDEVTLLSKNILSIKSFDGKEPTNKNGNRAAYGNNNYVLSNIHQWLNARGSNWYEPTHQYDAAPSNDNVLNSHNDYDNEPGFLTQFYDSAIGYMVSVDNMFEADTVDDNEVLSFTSKVYLASDSEMGFVDDTNEGFKFRIFRELDFDKRAYPTDKCVEQCEYTDAALNVSKNYSYWLRSIGTNKNNTDVSFISANGNMSYVGARNSKTGIRPVINVKSTMPIELSGVNVNNDLISKEIDNDGTR